LTDKISASRAISISFQSSSMMFSIILSSSHELTISVSDEDDLTFRKVVSKALGTISTPVDLPEVPQSTSPR
jgi:hypothetical protein